MAKKDEKDAVAPIIIKKIAADGHEAHGGAWKIALADMMTAMMAFFLLMWLLGATNEDQRKSIADYFKPTPRSIVDLAKGAGANGVLGGRSLLDDEGMPNAAMQTSLFDTTTPPRMENDTETEEPAEKPASAGDDEADAELEAAEKMRLARMQEEIKRKLAEDPELAALAEQVQFVQDPSGLRIDLVEKADFSMFGLGTSTLTPRATALLQKVAEAVASLPNKIQVRGHTDAFGFAGDRKRSNWGLSAERAEATRGALEDGGVDSARFARIEGAADTEPHVAGNPYDPRNRRISITLLTSEAGQPRAASGNDGRR